MLFFYELKHFLNYTFFRKFREKFAPDKVYSTSHSDVMTFSTFEKSPEDIFNFDSKLIDKFTMKDKSISLSTFGQNSTKNILSTSNQKVKYSEPNMQNIIFNRLYEENAFDKANCEKERSCKISYENETEIMKNCNCTHRDNVNHYCKCKNKQKNLANLMEKNAKLSVDPEVLLFAENQGYDLLLSSDNCKMSNETEEITSAKEDQNHMNGNCLYLTGIDLLIFAKQIATGMVINFLYGFVIQDFY